MSVRRPRCTHLGDRGGRSQETQRAKQKRCKGLEKHLVDRELVPIVDSLHVRTWYLCNPSQLVVLFHSILNVLPSYPLSVHAGNSCGGLTFFLIVHASHGMIAWVEHCWCFGSRSAFLLALAYRASKTGERISQRMISAPESLVLRRSKYWQVRLFVVFLKKKGGRWGTLS